MNVGESEFVCDDENVFSGKQTRDSTASEIEENPLCEFDSSQVDCFRGRDVAEFDEFKVLRVGADRTVFCRMIHDLRDAEILLRCGWCSGIGLKGNEAAFAVPEFDRFSPGGKLTAVVALNESELTSGDRT